MSPASFLRQPYRVGSSTALDKTFTAESDGNKYPETKRPKRSIQDPIENDAQDGEKQGSLRILKSAAAGNEASRMNSRFFANMSHELRTPVAGMIGMVERLLETNLDAEQKECVENIQQSTSELLTVINDILDFTTLGSGRFGVDSVSFSLLGLLENVNQRMSRAAQKKNVAYESLIQPELERDFSVIGNPDRFRQVLINVIDNSVKFTSEGTIRLYASVANENEETISVRFVVEDTGIGIGTEIQERIFQPFYQVDSSTTRPSGGIGLGLPITKTLVELMRGQITLKSELGHGTIVDFWIPFGKCSNTKEYSLLVKLASASYPVRSDGSVTRRSLEYHNNPTLASDLFNHTVQKLHGWEDLSINSFGHNDLSAYLPNLPKEKRRGIHILVVEDNIINQRIALNRITKLHFSCTAVSNGQQALAYLLKEWSHTHPRPEIILMDVQMPIRDGYSTTIAIRTETPFKDMHDVRNVPIIAMTASSVPGDKEKCLQAGMNDYLTKPVSGEVLGNMLIKWAIRGRRLGALGLPNDQPPMFRR